MYFHWVFRSDFRMKGVCSKSVTKKNYRNKFLVSKCIFKLVCHCQSDQRFVVRKRYCLKFFEQIVTVAYAKKQLPEVFCRKRLS